MPRVGILTLQREPTADICRAAEDGVPCTEPAWQRGLCARHRSAARQRGLVDRLGLPTQVRKRDLRLTAPELLQPGLCRVTEEGVPCTAPGKRRGLCVRHYGAIWQREDLDLERFAAPPLDREFRIKPNPQPGVCRLVELGKDCAEPAHARGLCSTHYEWLRAHDLDRFERLAEPDRRHIVYGLRAHTRPGRCRAAEDGVGCGERARTRGLCVHHYAVLRKDSALLAAIALPPTVPAAPAVLTVNPNPSAGICHILTDGVACTAPVEHRGLCMQHYRKLRSSPGPGRRLADYLAPERTPQLALKPEAQRAAGLCRVIEDAEPCQEQAFTRGLCRRHYRAAQGQGRLDELGAGPQDETTRQRARMPHAYFDKNILFDWCDATAFGSTGQQASCALVERMRAGTMLATISASAVTSAYNHVRHRAARPREEGGRGLDEATAERLARDTVSRMLGGSWRIQSLTPHELRSVLADADATHSYEDALEWTAYQQARAGQHGPRWFVTRDLDFGEGVAPWILVEAI